MNVAVVVMARRPGMDARETIDAVRAQSAAPIYLAGEIDAPYEAIHVYDTNPTRARNEAIRRSSADIILLTDADCIPAPDWVATLTAAFDDATVAGVKGIYATAQRHPIARLVQAEYERKYRRLVQRDGIDFIDTYSAAYRRSILIANDSFDDTFPYLEDQELSFRLASRGYRLLFEPSAIVHRRHASSYRAYIRKKFSIGYWKAQVVRRFPNRGVTDSYTPQVMKIQVGLMALLLGIPPILLTQFGWAGWGIGSAGIITLFMMTILPFIVQRFPKDASLAMRLPLLLMIRALALGFGYAWGLIRPAPITKTKTISGFNYVFKRTIDVMGGLVGCGILAVLLPWIALAIKLDSAGTIFFTQIRIGEQGRPFTVYKFRSMINDAEAKLDDLIDVTQLDEPAFKLDNDPRVTRIGRIVRRWSLDELPQFWNVLKGEMSLVGPRPEETRMVAMYNDTHRRRLAVKPGITGPMQVNGRGDLPLDERVRLEIAYIENYTILKDIQILLQTFPAVISGDGAR